ncbi:hypothetical protein [Bradyrhizobium sp. SZCCHNRI1009]|uniref:hypothetical protein n=1 Tax=unclassified Bradyrhizobium TaxID=2631580 RepID=UPI002916D34B|nr:hypothetical protein [Bradyrhizobium sp. SZCCHNRI1009]
MTDMQSNEARPRRKLPMIPRAVLAASVLAVFLFLHVVAATMLRGDATRSGAQADGTATLQPYD